jgi:hypothetical protein
MIELVTPEFRKEWGSPIEVEVRRRIALSVSAYAYEIADTPIVTDASFDQLAEQINPKQGTCHPILDEFFAYKFSPMTGMWIHEHPELDKIARTYKRYYAALRDHFEHPGVQKLLRRK